MYVFGLQKQQMFTWKYLFLVPKPVNLPSTF